MVLRSQTSGNAPNHTPKKQKRIPRSTAEAEAPQIEQPTSNSTPDKADGKKGQASNKNPEQSQAHKTKFIKSNWQNLEMQRQNSSATKSPLILMPKRIMSSKKEKAPKKEVEKKLKKEKYKL